MSVYVLPEVETHRVTVHVFGLWWVKLNDALVRLPEESFYGAHVVPCRHHVVLAPAVLLDRAHADVLPALCLFKLCT